jgi:hypothetical protein
MARLPRLALVPLALAAACSHVSVTTSGSGVTLAPRPAGCAIEFIRTRAPERPYDEIATLHWQGTMRGAEGAQEDLRQKACALGADAAVVTRDYVPNTQNSTGLMTATAIKYRPAPAPPAAPPPPTL